MEKIAKTNTKQKIWEAYQDIIRQMQERQQEKELQKSDEQKGAATPPAKLETKELSIENVIIGISTLKTNVHEVLNTLSDQLREEVEKLGEIKKTIAEENENLSSMYQIKARADTLIQLLEIQEQRKIEFEKRIAETEGKFQVEMESKKRRWTQEEEEYGYILKMKRRKEEVEYEISKDEKERTLAQREQSLREKENYLKEIETKLVAFPAELEGAVKDAQNKTKEFIAKEYTTATQLREKEIEKDSELSQLKILGLEKTAKEQAGRIAALEQQLTLATHKSQELALKIIESRKENPAPAQREESHKTD